MIVDSIGKNDQVLVLLNCLAASGETVSCARAVSSPAADIERSHNSHARALNVTRAKVLSDHARQQPLDPATIRQSFHNRSTDVRRCSTAADDHTISALEVVSESSMRPQTSPHASGAEHCDSS